jgi:hypothetical protein
VTVGDAGSLDLTNGMTLEAWVRPTAAGSKWRSAIVKENGTNIAYALYANRNTNVPNAEIHVANKLRQLNGTSQLPLDQWSHLAATYDGAAIRLYVDGTQVATIARTGSITTSAGALSLGGNGVHGEFFQGLMDEVRVYNRALTAVEIQADMTRSVGTPDSEAPTTPGNLTANGGLGTVALAWTAASDNVGVRRYNVHRSTTAGFTPTDANRIAQPTGTSYADSGLAANTYHYVVTAEDAAGNVGPPSNYATGTATADTTPPTVSVTAPSAGATVANTVTLNATAADDDAVAGVQFKVDGADVGSPDTTAPYSVQWDSFSVPNGDHDITAVARDRSANLQTSAAVRVRVENAAAPPDPDLVAAYGFDEGTGTTVRDESRKNNGGSIAGAVWIPSGRFGSALDFDGVDDRVNVADSDSLDLGNALTVSAYVRPDALASKWRTVLFKERTGNMVYSLYANESTNVPIGEITTGTTTVTAARGLTSLSVLGSWSHLAMTYDGASLRLYVNGTLVRTVARTGSIPASTGALRIGGNAIWGEYFDGAIDEVRIYKKVQTAAEIQADMGRSVSTPDTEPPTAAGGLAANGGIGKVSLSWTAGTDNVGIDGYDVHRSNTAGFTPTAANRIAQPSGTSYTDSGLAAGTYHYRVIARDRAGNTSPPSNEASGTATSDTTPPSVSITEPAAGATVFGTVTVKANATDDGTVAGLQFLLDGQPLGAEDTTDPWSTSWNTRTASNGTHQLSVRARDAAGNAATSAPVAVTVDNSAAPPEGLVAGYGFDEGTGTTVADVTANNNAGSVSGATWATGRFGAALSFDGTDDQVTVPDANSLDLTTGMTLSAYVRPRALGTAWRTVIFKERSGNLVYSLYANQNTSVPIGEITVGTSVTGVKGTTQLPLDAWRHLAVTYDGANLRLYVDAVQVGSVAKTGPLVTSTGALRIGANSIWGERFNGLIDEVRIYNRALPPAEIEADMSTRVARDTVAPTVTGRAPASGATGVAVSEKVTATFSESMDPATVTAATFELHDAAANKVAATISYDDATGKATLNPSSALHFGTTYTATVQGGASGDRVKDQAGNALAADHSWSFTTEPPPPPVLLVRSSANPFSSYAAEILRAEGLNEFVTAEPSLIDTSYLANFDVVVVGDVALSDADVADLTSYVNAGGNVVALRPDKKLAGLLGLTDAGATLAQGYVNVDTASGPGAGIADQTMQYHGAADRYTLNGATAVATLYSDRNTATTSPAVTLRSVGSNGGQAAAFAYDLARSVVFTRQGKPAWAGQDRDGINPIRTNDLFFGGMAGDLQPDWIDTERIHIPQADEQQRLLANLIVTMSIDRKPLPRFWYLPRGEKAAVVMTGDDHAEGGTPGRFEQYKAASPAGCSVADWECVRGTSYVYPNTPLTDAQAAAYEAEGFEVSLHINVTGGACGNYTPTSIIKEYNDNMRDFALAYPSVPKPLTERTHCVSWSDWASQPRQKEAHGIRLDTNYYHFPSSWIGAKPGFMTGSGMPMRFADLDGTTFDVYQAHTHMNDEAGQAYPFTINTLLDRALGPDGYYGAFTANMHTDEPVSTGSDAIVASAQARDVPVITARQLLRWTDGRNGSSFRSLSWSGGTLAFTVEVAAGANGLQGMLPLRAGTRTLGSITRGCTAVPFTTRTVKGIEYAFFTAAAGVHEATYTP